MLFTSSTREVNSAFRPTNTIGYKPVEEPCDGELEYNNKRMWKHKRNTLGYPGRTFKRLDTENSRSQSLPSCLENEKQNIPLGNEEDIHTENSNEHDENFEEQTIVKQDSPTCNQAWFKTWPERGNDKIINVNNNESMETIQGGDAPASATCDEGALQSDRRYSLSSNNTLNYGDHYNSQNSFNSVNGFSHTSTVVRTKTLNDCDNTEQNMCKYTNVIQNEMKCSIPLTELLQSMPLAYSPVTRQLHIINKNYVSNNSHLTREVSKHETLSSLNGDIKNGLKPLECLVEEKLAGIINIDRKRDSEYAFSSVCDDSVSHESPHSTLQRISACDTSLSRTDASSFSSIVSSLSESSPSTNDDIIQGNLLDSDTNSQTAHSSLSSRESSSCFEDTGAKPKRRGISSFFSRNVFSWKLSRENQSPTNSSSSSSTCNGSPSWKLFSKTPKLRNEVSDEDADSRPSSSCGTKQYEDIVASSSALILHQRPSNLPAKSQDEEHKHRIEYQKMVEAARKKELKEAKLRKKQLQQQLKLEEQLANAARVWNNEILPKWDSMKSSRKTQDLWWQGIPPSVRGKVWRLAIGNDLNITHQLYDICVSRAQERLKAGVETIDDKSEFELDNPDKEASVELIQLDIARTFPNLCIFQKGGPYYDILHSLIGAYVCYRPDVGYVQGMSFIAAVLILNLEAADAFICFANLLNQPCHMAFFRLNEPLMQAYYATYNDFFRENLPRLASHFQESALSADLYLLDWLYTVFAKAMPLDVACRVWDVFLRDGEEFLFKTALGVLHLHQDTLLQLDFLHGAQFLTKLPDDLAADQLFKSIEFIHMNIGKLRFSEVLTSHIENCNEPS